MKNKLVLKLAILSCCFVTASLNAIAGNIPAMAADMKDTPLYLLELVTTVPSLFSMLAVLCSSRIASAIGYKKIVLAGALIAGIFGTLPVILNDIWLILLARGIFGFGYLAFVPFLQERVSTGFASFAATGTTVILVFQGLGAFVAPYAGPLLSVFASSLGSQFLICGILYLILAALGWLICE